MSDKRVVRCVLLCTALFAIAPAGCGGSDDGDSDASSSAERAAVLKADSDLRAAFIAGDAETYCSGLTPASARAEGTVLGPGGTCEKLVRATQKRGAKDANKKPKVLGVDFDGDRATVKLVISGSDRPFTAPYVKRDGKWLGDWRGVTTTKAPDAESSFGSQ